MISYSGGAQRGLTLVEIMIALALSSILMVAILKITSSNTQTLRLAKNFTDMQTSAKFALEVLSQDIRMAGYMGCINTLDSSKVFNNLRVNGPGYDASLHAFNTRISAVDNYPENGATIGGIIPAAGTDVFSTTVAEVTNVVVSGPAVAGVIQITGPVSQLSNIKEGLTVMLTDCAVADIFSVGNNASLAKTSLPHAASVANGPDNLADDLASGSSYTSGAQLLVMNSSTYFLAESTLYPGVNSLYRLSSLEGAAAQELVPYIEDMQLLYSIDTNNDKQPDIYKTAAQVAADGNDMSRDVYAVNVQLVLTSRVNVGAHQLDGYADDGRMRKRYSRLIQVRNAGLGLDE